MQQAHEKCLQKSKISPMTLLSFGEFWNVSENSAIGGIRDYVYCCLTTMRYFDDKAGFDVDGIMEDVVQIPYLKNIPIERSMIEQCADKNETSDSADVWAFRGFRCLMEAIKEKTSGLAF